MADIDVFDFHFHSGPNWLPLVRQTLDSGDVSGILCCTDLRCEHEAFEAQNEALLALARQKGKQVLPLLAMIHLNRPDWLKQARTWFDKYPELVGVKLHPPVSDYLLTSELLDPLFDFALERNLFIASHTCPVPGQSAIGFHAALRRRPKTRLVIYHGSTHEESAYLATAFAHVYVEPSWLGFFPNLFQLMRKLGGHRKMLAGTDGPGWFKDFAGSPYQDLVNLSRGLLPDEPTVRGFCAENARRFLSGAQG